MLAASGSWLNLYSQSGGGKGAEEGEEQEEEGRNNVEKKIARAGKSGETVFYVSIFQRLLLALLVVRRFSPPRMQHGGRS